MRDRRRARTELLAYFGATFGISWIGAIAAARGGRIALTFVFVLLGPVASSLALTAAFDGARGLRELAHRLLRWRVGRSAAALLVAPALLVVVLALLSQYSSAYVPRVVTSDARGTIAFGSLAVGLVAGVFEEIGWTGFATPRLLRHRTWLESGIVLGLAWSVWHALPDALHAMDRYAGLWPWHMLEWIVALTAYRVLMTWIYARTESLLLGMLMHSAFTGSQWLLWPDGASVEAELLWYGVYAVMLWAVVAAVIASTRALPRVSATWAEKTEPMPGDARIPDPLLDVTHAITIDATAEEIWPWLVQLGATHAGWYSWDVIDDGGVPSADVLLPEHQRVEPGDVMPAIPGATDAFVVAAVDAPYDLVLVVPGRAAPIMTWEHLLEPIGPARTRLVVRGRVARGWQRLGRDEVARRRRFVERVYVLLARMPEPWMRAIALAGHRFMEARHLRGIKRRVERRATSST